MIIRMESINAILQASPKFQIMMQEGITYEIISKNRPDNFYLKTCICPLLSSGYNLRHPVWLRPKHRADLTDRILF